MSVEKNGPQIHKRSGGRRVKVRCFLISVNDLLDGSAFLFEFKPALEPVIRLHSAAQEFGRFPGISRSLRQVQQLADLILVKIEQQLTRNWLHVLFADLHLDSMPLRGYPYVSKQHRCLFQSFTKSQQGAANPFSRD